MSWIRSTATGRSRLYSTLAAAFAVAMAGSVVVLTDRLPALAGHTSWPAAPVRAPHAVMPAGKPSLRVSRQVALGIAMACMLIQML